MGTWTFTEGLLLGLCVATTSMAVLTTAAAGAWHRHLAAKIEHLHGHILHIETMMMFGGGGPDDGDEAEEPDFAHDTEIIAMSAGKPSRAA